MNFADHLIEKIAEKGSPICVGLDPQIGQMPVYLKTRFREEVGDSKEAVAATFLEFNRNIIDGVADLVPAVKPNLAFYEKYGWQGMKCFEETVAYARSKGLLIIEDSKKNDISHTAEAYAAGSLGEVGLMEKSVRGYDVDAVTINIYLGSDTLSAFERECERFGKGIFAVVKTSNPSAGELQDLVADGSTVFEAAARMLARRGENLVGKSGYSSLGMVVGANCAEAAEKIRKIFKKTFFLVPGYGAQGGAGKDLAGYFNEDGLGALVNNSRGICYAYLSGRFAEEEYAEAAREATLAMKQDLNFI